MDAIQSEPGAMLFPAAMYPFGTVASFDEGLRYIAVGGRGWADLGIDPQSLEGKEFRQLWDEVTAAPLEDLARRALAGEEGSARIPYDGHVFEVWAGPLPGSAPAQGLLVTRDVTREEGSASWASLLADAVDAAPIGITIAVVDERDSPLVHVNDGFCRLTGYSRDEALGRNCRFLQGFASDDEARRRMKEAIAARRPITEELVNVRKDGSTFLNRVSLLPIGRGDRVSHYLGVQENVSALRRTPLDREHAQRLIELGAFTGGIAHDFNNLLMEVVGHVEACRGVPAESLEEELDAIDGVVRRGATLIRSLLSHARRHVVEDDATSASLVERCQQLDRLLPASVQVFVEAEDGLTLAIGDVRLEQILLNLARNAADAMPQGGELRVSLAAAEAGWARLVVSDTGVGMSEAAQARAFERFFTTKGAEGTGLGLYTVAELVEAVGGTVSVSSVLGEGTTFELRLPTLRPPASHASSSLPPPAQPSPARRVLVVDDEPGLRRVLCRFLRKHGIEVVVASDGSEGWRAFRNQGPFDAVVTDADMPRLRGEALLSQVADHSSAAPPRMVLMTGHGVEGRAELPPHAVYLEKPFDLKTLLSALA